MNLENKKIVVTGGSRGIGAGIVKSLAQAGATVAFTYTSRPDAAEKVLAEIKALNPKTADQHFCLSMNVADPDSVEKGFAQILERFGQIDGLVNNAGITKDGLLLRMKTEDFDDVIQTNLRGSFLCTKVVSKIMLKARKGSIVNVTSVIGHMGNAGQANYAASKAGTAAFGKSVAQELGSRNIRVNCVAPGFIVTDMTDAMTDEQKKAIFTKIPLQKLGDVEDVANAVTFLLSEESKYITGQTLHVNGGMWMD
jgi:3-oxoacyl-[acyl-carrier protein] reductase